MTTKDFGAMTLVGLMAVAAMMLDGYIDNRKEKRHLKEVIALMKKNNEQAANIITLKAKLNECRRYNDSTLHRALPAGF